MTQTDTIDTYSLTYYSPSDDKLHIDMQDDGVSR